MINTLLGIKKNMTSAYDARGRRVGVTVVEISPNLITQIKKEEGKDKYDSVQIGFGDKKSIKKPQIGHLKKVGISKKVRWFKELRIKNNEFRVKDEDLGKEVAVGDIFRKGDAVKVTGISKGKGFQGGVRRHGFAGGPKTHGQSDRHRAPGSIGQTTTPGRVYKGKKMAGHMGVDQISVRGLEVVSVNKGENLLFLKGAVPGFTGGLVQIQKLGRIKGYTPPPEEKESDEQLEASEAKQEEKVEEPTNEVEGKKAE